jgi:hypothetical protein
MPEASGDSRPPHPRDVAGASSLLLTGRNILGRASRLITMGPDQPLVLLVAKDAGPWEEDA